MSVSFKVFLIDFPQNMLRLEWLTLVPFRSYYYSKELDLICDVELERDIV